MSETKPPKLVTITPDMAKEWLRTNTYNRPLNHANVKRLAEAMKKGDWKLNGEMIQRNGSLLINGQHRLHACIVADVPFQSYVLEDVNPDVFDTIDTGAKRTAADALAVKGEKNARTLAAAAVVVEMIYSGRGTLVGKSKNATNQDVLRWVNKYLALRNSVEHCGHYNCKILAPSLLAAAHYIFSRLDSVKADSFIEQLATGENISANSSISALRKRLIDNAMSPKKYDKSYLFALVIRAWNAEREGRNLRVLRVNEEGDFPVAI